MHATDAALAAVLRRERLVFFAGLGVVLVVAWLWLLSGAGMQMSAVTMPRMAGMDALLLQQVQWTPGYAVLMFCMWWVMMIAMMLPSAAPVLLLFMRVNRGTSASSLVPTSVFAVGYVLAWGVFSFIATIAQWAMESAKVLSPMLETSNVWLSAGIVVAAGLWQLTPLKRACLRHCRTPLSYLLANWRPGRRGALRMGLEHGTYCLGCCWFLMALLFVGGVMNLFWIAALAIFVLVEKITPYGHWISRASGVVLVICGVLLPAV